MHDWSHKATLHTLPINQCNVSNVLWFLPCYGLALKYTRKTQVLKVIVPKAAMESLVWEWMVRECSGFINGLANRWIAGGVWKKLSLSLPNISEVRQTVLQYYSILPWLQSGTETRPNDHRLKSLKPWTQVIWFSWVFFHNNSKMTWHWGWGCCCDYEWCSWKQLEIVRGSRLEGCTIL